MSHVTITLTDEELVDVLTTACEGGSTYWARSSRHLRHAMREPVTIWDCETGEKLGELTAEKMRAAGAIVASKVGAGVLADMVSEGPAMDADSADAWVQVALLGEVVYG